jgi:hypothetical protein
MLADLLLGWHCLCCKLLLFYCRLVNPSLICHLAQQMIFGCMLYSSLITSVQYTDPLFKVLEPHLVPPSLVLVLLVSVPSDQT